LVSQIPALVISTASGMIIARASSSSSMGVAIASQIAGQPKALYITSGVLVMMAFVPGLPFLPFVSMGALLSFGNYFAEKGKKNAIELAEQEEEPEEIAEPEEKIEDFLHPDPFEVEIGYGLIPLVDANQGGNLLDRISAIRKSLAMELGVIVPPIRIRDNIQLKSNEYCFKIYGIEAASSEVMLGHYLLLNPDKKITLRGVKTTEPTFGLPAMWIADSDKEKAEMLGYSVIEPPSIISTHIMEILKNNAYKLLDRQETQRMLDHLKKTRPALVDGIVPEQVSLGAVTQILKNLLAERIPVRNLVNIMGTIADYASFTKDPDILTDYVRTALAETITDHFKQNMPQLTVATFEPMLEDRIMESVKENGGKNPNLRLSPDQINGLFEQINEKVEKMLGAGSRPIILVSPQIRRAVKNLISPVLPNVTVLSYTELTPDTNLNSVGAVPYPNEASK
ncbi:MAG: FHIPEP family type III secretion protein, partial [Candidatus Marinimicrobia bacterium]|nr:FHIPEP family type III secretion protein [Candidatus Neomarinimicrobiota bacterium]